MHPSRRTSCLFALLCATLFFLLSTQHASAFSPIFVKPNGNGSGNGAFANATNLQHALRIATAGDQIWAATGLYTPGITVSDTFTLTSGVALYGGFALTATQLSQRDWVANPTVLSGDIDANDSTDAHGVITDTANITGANSLHVVTADGTATAVIGTTKIDGFIITAGDSSDIAFGGGFYCNGNDGICNPHIENVTFSSNRANFGGAIYNNGKNGGESSPSLANVTFIRNRANFGGALLNDGGSNGKSNPSLVNVTFSNNSASQSGGAMYNRGEVNGESSPNLVNVTFTGNSATDDGGGLFNDGSNNGKSGPSLVNVTFISNTAGSLGGALINYGESSGVISPSLVNVTFFTNSAPTGGAMYNSANGNNSIVSLTNVILWDNPGTRFRMQIANHFDTLVITSSLVQGGINDMSISTDTGYPVVDGGGNLAADPLFVDASHGNLRLKSGSPAIDAGTNSAITATTDLDGNPRKIDGNGDLTPTVDIGAYEFLAYVPLTVTVTGNGSGQLTRSPAGTPCTAPCSALYLVGTSVTLTATAAPTSTFAGWSGTCSGTAPCHLTVTAAKQVTATFSAKNGSVQGKVVDDKGKGSKGIAGATVTLTSATGRIASATLLTQTTDSNGNYLVADVPAGDYTLTVHITGKADSAPLSITLQPDEAKIIPTITLQPSKASLHLPLLTRTP